MVGHIRQTSSRRGWGIRLGRGKAIRWSWTQSDSMTSRGCCPPSCHTRRTCISGNGGPARRGHHDGGTDTRRPRDVREAVEGRVQLVSRAWRDCHNPVRNSRASFFVHFAGACTCRSLKLHPPIRPCIGTSALSVIRRGTYTDRTAGDSNARGAPSLEAASIDAKDAAGAAGATGRYSPARSRSYRG
jgi:hypothetical protein